jgi:hypothetical protein
LAISLRAAGTATSGSAAVTAVNPSVPATTTTNDISILVVGAKPYTTTITTPSGWTKLGEITSGTRAGASDSGSTKVAMYYRISAPTGAIGNIGQSGAVALQAVIHSYQCGAGETWDVSSFTTGADTTVGTNYSATGAANINLASGDWLIVGCCATDVAGGTTPASEALTATGITFGTLTVRTEDWDSPTSQNLWILFWDRPVSSGTSSAAPVQTWTWGGSAQEGSSAFLRLRAAVSSTPKSDSDTATGTDNAGTVTQFRADTEAGTGTEASALNKPAAGSETASGTDATAARAFTEADLGTGTESTGAIRQGGSETVLGTDSGGTVAATVTGSGETGTGTEAQNKTMTEAEAGTGTDNAGMVTQPRSGADTATGTDDAGYLRIIKTDSDNSGTWTDTHTNRRFDGQSDNPTITEGETQSVLLPQNKSGSDTSSAAEGQTRLQPGSFSQIPSPKVWSNGDALDHGTLNKEWRDTFNWMLRKTSPAFSGYNGDGASLTFTSNVAVPIKTEELKRGSVQHATNDTKVYVYEPGNYLILVQIGVNTSGLTGGTLLSSVLKVNGVVQSAGDITRAGGLTGIQHMVTYDLNAGDYVEIALGGSWTGTATGGTTTAVFPWLWLWWRSN